MKDNLDYANEETNRLYPPDNLIYKALSGYMDEDVDLEGGEDDREDTNSCTRNSY